MRDNQVALIKHNADDLKRLDIPILKEKISDYFRNFDFLPQELRDEVAPLLENAEYDSAVRKAFLVIKQKAIDKYQMSAQLDGEDMVNFLFSETDKIRVHEDVKRRKAFRDLWSGYVRFFRNKYMHNLSADEKVPVECVLSIAAYMLNLLDASSEM